MNVIHTTISKDYVRDWGVTEGVRELIQNALDGEDEGYRMGISYIRKEHTLIIYNLGAGLPLNSLLLGTTTKADNTNARGAYGEGFKIGILALIRAGKEVTIHNSKHNERWYSNIAYSKEFDAKVLSFEIFEKSKLSFAGKLAFKIKGITPEEWNGLKLHFLHIYKPDKSLTFKSSRGTVLQGDIFKGRIYCGGIYVDTHKDLAYGYDFATSELQLNRDRNMASSFDVQWATSKIWAELSDKKRLLEQTKMLLQSGAVDVSHLDHFVVPAVVSHITEEFKNDNKDNKSYPVTDNDEAHAVKDCGHIPVYSKEPHTKILRRELGGIDKLKRETHLNYTVYDELGSDLVGKIEWVVEKLCELDGGFKLNVIIAEFITNPSSIVVGDTLVINIDITDNRYTMLREGIKHYCEEHDKGEIEVWMRLYEISEEQQ